MPEPAVGDEPPEATAEHPSMADSDELVAADRDESEEVASPEGGIAPEGGSEPLADDATSTEATQERDADREP
jgi:hypothetical protein